METAVIFTNHFRSFKEIFPIIKNYYKGCDLFMSTYNENYDYFSFQEKKDLIEKNKGRNKVELRKNRVSYTTLPEESINFIKNTFDIGKYEIVTESDFNAWYSRMVNLHSNITFDTMEETYFHYGQLWSKFRGLELVKNSGKVYDYVIFNRCDIVPTSNSAQDIIKALKATQKKGVDKLLTYKLTVNSGMLNVANQFFACTFNDAIKISDIFFYRMEEIFKNPLFLHFKKVKSIDKFYLLGLLIHYAEINVKSIDFLYEQKIRKEHIIRGLDFLDKTARSDLRLEENKLFKF